MEVDLAARHLMVLELRLELQHRDMQRREECPSDMLAERRTPTVVAPHHSVHHPLRLPVCPHLRTLLMLDTRHPVVMVLGCQVVLLVA